LSLVVLQLVWINARSHTSTGDESGSDLPVAGKVQLVKLEILWMFLLLYAVYHHGMCIETSFLMLTTH